MTTINDNDLVWISPKLYDDLNNVLRYQITIDKLLFSSSSPLLTVPHELSTLRIIISYHDITDTRDMQSCATTLPTTITHIELYFDIPYDVTNDLSSIILKLNKFLYNTSHSLRSLTISNSNSNKSSYNRDDRVESILLARDKSMVYLHIPPSIIHLEIDCLSQDIASSLCLSSVKSLKAGHCTQSSIEYFMTYLEPARILTIDVVVSDNTVKSLVIEKGTLDVKVDDRYHIHSFDITPMYNSNTRYLLFEDIDTPEEPLPENLKSLHLLGNYSSFDSIPDTVEYLICERLTSLYSIKLPRQLRYLSLGIEFDHLLTGIPLSTEYLELFLSNRWPLSYGYIPNTVRYLKINCDQQQQTDISVINIPSTIKRVYIDPFKSHLVKIIDESQYYSRPQHPLKGLVLSDSFNQILTTTSLPENLLELTFGSNYRETIIDRVLPPSLTTLVSKGATCIFATIPPNLVSACLGKHHDSLAKMSLLNEYHINYKNQNVDLESMPNLKRLVIKDCYYESPIKVPPNVKELVVKTYRFQLAPNSSLEKLYIETKMRQEPIQFPQSLKSITNISTKIELESLPFHLQELTLNYYLNRNLINSSNLKKSIIDINNNNKHSYNNNQRDKDKDLFFNIWRSVYLQFKILDFLICPFDKKETNILLVPFKPNQSTLFIKNIKDFDHNIETGIKKVIIDYDCLLALTRPIPQNFLKLMDIKYHVYQQDVSIPVNTTHILWPLNQVISPGVLPNGILSCLFGNDYNQIIPQGSLPESLVNIVFGSKFNQDLDNIHFPLKLKYLTFGNGFRQTLKSNRIPMTLKHLKLGYMTRRILKKINQFDTNIDHLEFKTGGPEQVDQTHLPKSIKYVRLNMSFQSEPCTITFLPNIKCVYTKEPQEILYVQEDNSKTIKKKMENNGKINRSIQLNLLMNIDKFIKPNILGQNIKSIMFQNSFNQLLLPGSLPESLESLVLEGDYNQPIGDNVLPKSLVTLVFGSKFEQPLLPNIIPPNVKSLSFQRGYYNENLLHWIPCSVQEFTIGSNDTNINNPLFPVEKISLSITKLIIGDNQPIFSVKQIPSSVTFLKLGPCLTYQCIGPNVLYLETSKDFDQPLHILFN
ncbi:hypothetical protein CYY_006742 [Polysphondylium violaceum]|uniref:FNIP repeat-containing protein n=1 Tax=Polysphondylium violaceum TaxID=133409 RepID=A0A8J4PQW9_9MYCE|nr:hypothetical protein CYY_006742 [Polysphondylium violaceum]